MAKAKLSSVTGSMYLMSRARWLKCWRVSVPWGTSGRYMKSIWWPGTLPCKK